jgi:DNA-binding GntR family transcriptional regulator
VSGGRGVTRTEQVYAELRADILSGRLVPGARLPFADLSARYRSSLSAIREGLQRLVEQGLVVSEPQQGFRVMSLSIEDLLDLTAARCEIEGLALRQSVEHGDIAWESGVVAASHTLDRTPEPAPSTGGAERSLSTAWSEAHREFHEALLAACPNRRLRSIASSLRDAAELYRHWSWRVADDQRDAGAEHRELLDAALARDAELAVTLLADHLTATSSLLVAANGGADPSADGAPSAMLASSDRAG